MSNTPTPKVVFTNENFYLKGATTIISQHTALLCLRTCRSMEHCYRHGVLKIRFFQIYFS